MYYSMHQVKHLISNSSTEGFNGSCTIASGETLSHGNEGFTTNPQRPIAFVSLWHPWFICTTSLVLYLKKELINASVGREHLNNTSPKWDAVTFPTLEACHLAEDDRCLMLCSKMWASNVTLYLSNTSFCWSLFISYTQCVLPSIPSGRDGSTVKVGCLLLSSKPLIL